MFRSQRCRRTGPLERLKGVVIIEDVKKVYEELKESIERKEVKRILDRLKRLDDMSGISRATLEEVKGLGKTVNKLKKYEHNDIAKNAKELVDRWKLIVKESVEREKRRKNMFGDTQEEKRRRKRFCNVSRGTSTTTSKRPSVIGRIRRY